MSQQYQIPGTPRVTSPTPPPLDSRDGRDEYFTPSTRSGTSKQRVRSSAPIDEENQDDEESSDSSLEKRARTRSRSPKAAGKKRQMSGLTAVNPKSGIPPAISSRTKKKPDPITSNGKATSNGTLSPSSAGASYWREFSRSPSPLGLIPIHRHWRSFVHRHEIPRKILHLSIGFLTLRLYTTGVQSTRITPLLLSALIPIACTDYLRHHSPSFNRFYVQLLGALMRESEFHGWNGVIWYLLGAWTVLQFFPKDVGVMGVLLLSWCDTAASTMGRLYGRYTPRIRKGKSLAGSAAACAVGIATAAAFWGWLAPRTGSFPDDPINAFMFSGRLGLPGVVKGYLGWTGDQGIITGPLALGVMSLWTGVVASASEVVDLFGWDDNLTIPVLSGLGIWGFLKVFG
ncbi:MAG: hypothetical protein M1830_010620 [Pleopsidium flavum]|nr:MAG: hypothetical protein M1830_010620 [Pleopsidium flavum]